MCYAAGSLTVACPMCKVFPHAKCPHVMEVCRNRNAHPRMDVMFIKNAEVERFKGCGYCKWANIAPPPPPDFMGYKNPGWPGCCRAPFPTEYMSIPAAEWPAVNKVHNVPIPAEIKAVLDSIAYRPSALSPTYPRRTANDRRQATSGSLPSSRSSTLSRASGANRRPSASGSSPSASPNMSRNSSSVAVSSIFNTSPVEASPQQRVPDAADKRIDGVHSSRSSPTRKIAELDQAPSPKRASSVKRPSVTPATTSVSVSKVVVGSPTSPHNQGSVRRKESISKTAESKRELPSFGPPPPAKPPQSSRTSPPSSRPPTLTSDADARNQLRDDDDMSSSSGSSDGMLSDSTVTSDGGFTDYLSDESEAELQRQAEAKAALVALNMAEELEFKAARLQLAHVDLRPPKTWNPANITNTPSSNRPRGTSRGT